MTTEVNEYDKITIVEYMGWSVFNNNNKNTTIKYKDENDFKHLEFVLKRINIIFKNNKDKGFVTINNKEW